MKEKLYTIELTDALNSRDECLFCWLERKLERENLEFVLGSSYMESDVREKTSEKGFCRNHTKMMYDYGNTLGNAWILKSRMEHMRQEFARQMQAYGEIRQGGGSGKTAGMQTAASGGKGGWLNRLLNPNVGMGTAKSKAKRGQEFQESVRSPAGEPREAASKPVEAPHELPAASGKPGPAVRWLRSEESHCYICSRMREIYGRMLDTFVYMLRSDPDFAAALMESNGFCLHHFSDVLAVCGEKMKPQEKAEWLPKLGELMGRNLDRVQEDVDWLIEKYDYRNKDAEWKQSKDAVQRAMQKLTGGHPADAVFQCRK